MALTLSYVARSEVGLVRKNNQDSAYVSPTMLMVADGMGGAAAGDLASAVAIDELRDTDGDHTETDMIEVVAGAITRANERIRDLVAVDPSLDGMGTTVCGLLFDGEQLAVANIGDSRAYRLRDGEFMRITRDHSWVQTLVDDGRITEAEALVHPHRSLILKVLNGQPNHVPDLEPADVQAGDRYLICSDGLCGMVTDAAIEEVIGGTDAEQVVDDLVRIAYAEGGLDNITIILADVVDNGPLGETLVLGAAAELDLAEAVDDTEDTRQLPTDGIRSDPNARDKAEEARYQPTTKGRRSAGVKVLLVVLLPLLVIGGGLFGWYSFLQTKYYVGDSDELVTVFRGVPDTLAGIRLSSPVQVHNTKVNDLPLFYQDKVRAAIVVPDLAAAAATAEELRLISLRCIAQRQARADQTTTPSPSPTPSVTATTTSSPRSTTSPTVSPTTSPNASPTSPTPTQSPSADTSPKASEDC